MPTRADHSNFLSPAGRAAAFVGEHLFLLLALALMIPPVPSEKGTTYSFACTALLVMLATIASRGCAMRLGRETLFGLVLKPAITLAAAFAIHLRLTN